MHLDTAISPVLLRASELLEVSCRGYQLGAEAFERTDVSGADWQERFNAGIRELAGRWTPAQQALHDARGAVAALGAGDERAVQALATIDGALAFVDRGYSYVSRVFYDLPRPLTPEFAHMATGRVGGAGRTIAHALGQAAASVRALASAAPASAA